MKISGSSRARRPRIAIDGCLLSIPRGIGNTVANVLRALATMHVPFEIIVYVTGREDESTRPTSESIRYRRLPSVPYPLWENVVVPLACARDAIDVLHSPGNTGPLVLPPNVRRVTTIHDLIFFASASLVGSPTQVRQRLQYAYYRTSVPHAARRSQHVITDSRFSRDELIEKLHIDGERISVVPLGTEPSQPLDDDRDDAALLQELGVSEPFSFALGAPDTRKNTARILRAFARTRERRPEIGMLVIAGLTAEYRATLARSLAKRGLSEHVTLLGFVTPQRLSLLYRRAYVFLYPSLYEGFGLPVLEAMAHGTAVIASRTTSIPEVAGDAAYLIDPTSEAALGDAIAALFDDEARRRELQRRGRLRARAFSWQNTAAATLAVYETALLR